MTEENTTSVNFEMVAGKVAPDTRQYFADAISSLSDGWYNAHIKPVKTTYTSTRYKYWFGHVMETILMTCGRFFEVLEGDAWRPARTTDEIHEVLKQKYNPIMIRTPFGIYTASNTTTALSDRDFINQFEEAVIIEFSQPPYGCDFMSREEYALMMKERKKQSFPDRKSQA